jgi:hypothetical protein
MPRDGAIWWVIEAENADHAIELAMEQHHKNQIIANT